MNEIEIVLKLLQAHLKNIKKKIAHIFHFSQNVSKEIAVHSDIAIAKPTKPVCNSHFIEKKRPACNNNIWRPNVNPIKIIINRYQHPIALYLIFFYFISKWPLIHMPCNCECRFVRYEKPLWMQVLQYLATASHSQRTQLILFVDSSMNYCRAMASQHGIGYKKSTSLLESCCYNDDDSP